MKRFLLAALLVLGSQFAVAQNFDPNGGIQSSVPVTGAVPTAANPTASIGNASATNGSATTYMRSDAAPGVTYGSSANTVTQGNDARLGAGAVTGAVKSNGANVFGQAASTDLSDTTGIARLASAQSFTAAQRGTPVALTISTATFTPNFDTGQNYSATLVHASCPCTIANPSTTPVAGQSGTFQIIQSSTGSDTIGTWGSQYKFAGGTKPTLSTAANAVDTLSYFVVDATHIQVSTFGLAFQ